MIIPTSVILAGTFGSLHCAGMCGGWVMHLTPDTHSKSWYAFGRLFSYSILGAAAGWLGDHLLDSSGTTLIIGFLALLILGKHLKAWRSFLSPHLFGRLKGSPPLLAGIVTGFLPCALLHGVLVMAAASGSWWAGSVVTSVFCLLSFPAIFGAQHIMRMLTRNLPRIRPAVWTTISAGWAFTALSLHWLHRQGKLPDSIALICGL